MKKCLTLILLFLFFQNSFPQSTNSEFRGIWVVTWEYIGSGGSVETNKERIRTILDNLVKANMTSVLWQVRQGGTAYYQSSYEPWGPYAGGTYPGFDPLEYAVEEAHKRGLELHAWFNVFASGNTTAGTPAQEHPEWICRDASGAPMVQNIALSPGLPEVREYLNTVAMELVSKYDIDGLHLDYIRWNEYSSTSNLAKTSESDLLDGMITENISDEITSEGSRYLYDYQHPYSAGVPSGYSAWPDWWRNSVTDFVRTLQDSIKNVKPWVKLSCAALGNYNWSGWNGYYEVYQDAALWFNEGYVDQIAGMHYHWTNGAGFLGMLVTQCPSCWSQYIQPGINAGRLYTVGPPSYLLQDYGLWNNHADIVNSVRTVPWVDGFQFFSYASWRDRNYFSDAANLFFKQKRKVRNALASSEIVSTPQIQLEKTDSAHYKITVTPQAISQPYWFALYRSKSNSFDKDTTEIVSVNFSNSSFSIDQVFDGLQDYNGQYVYSATMLNRYWKESDFSNTVSTDLIPSSAPVVVSTKPAEGAVVPLNSTIEINFSKSINIENIQNYVTLSPSVTLLTFSAAAKKLVLSTSGLEYSTNYTLKIEGSLPDVNGRMLDGNNDGEEGDPFFLHFSAAGADSVGPVVISTIPQLQDSVDLESVISFNFDEKLNPASISGNVILFRNGIQVSCEAKVTNFETGAVIDIRPRLTQNAEYLCVLKKDIKDLFDNPMTDDFSFSFNSKAEGYSLFTSIDNFTLTGWEQPNFSGSTVGIDVTGTSWGYSSSIYVPQSVPRKGAVLSYKWNPDITPRLLREYLSGGTPRTITFDKSNILQVYVNGDGSGTLFRIALDEDYGASTYSTHEVSNWIPINWYGWKLVEWDLSDPNTIGTWIGNGLMDGSSYRMDSFQLTNGENSAMSGTIYFDEFRAVKKSYVILSSDEVSDIPLSFRLYQNYPNPFNPTTIIPFDVDRSGKVSLDVYDILGRKVKSLLSEEINAGHYKVNFDASGLASGQYIYRLSAGENQVSEL